MKGKLGVRGTTTVGIIYEDVKREALALPEVEESSSYGTPALKVRGKLMVRLKEDLETIVLRTTWEERERLTTLYPETFYVTDHYRAYPWVLMRLSGAPQAFVSKWLENAWRLVAPKSLVKKHFPEFDS
ncbi:MAG TPA: MmcQ/YjbR family DNA-binding protein [Xanthomonadaceae bacterium]|nr:MmcQ/YjbR family DNA-binding protein [Xanthomonadaceae bacterium]